MRKSITILKHKLEIDCQEKDELHIDNAIDLLQKKINEITNNNSNSNREKIIIMSSLTLLVGLIQESYAKNNQGEQVMYEYQKQLINLSNKLDAIL